MARYTRKSASNVVPITAKAAAGCRPAHAANAKSGADEAHPAALTAAGSPNDPRMKEAMRLMQSFLAIEDSAGRTALITLAERLASHDWARKVRQG